MPFYITDRRQTAEPTRNCSSKMADGTQSGSQRELSERKTISKDILRMSKPTRISSRPSKNSISAQAATNIELGIGRWLNAAQITHRLL